MHEREQEERHRQEQEELWLRRELLARKQFREQQKKQEASEAAREAERQRIQKEFEELQRIEEQRREERRKREEEAQLAYEMMMEKIYEYMEGGSLPDELKSNIESNPNKEICPLFSKTNACRFGMFCTRNHIRPKLSRLLFIPNFFSHIKLEYPGTDIDLECSDEDLINDYKTFFDDVIEEFKVFGEIVNFRACMNTRAHLRGNVFVEYASDR